MDDLDLSTLTDDQLLTLVRATLREVASRHPSLSDAVRAAMLDERERIEIARNATEKEAAKIRAEERARVAAEAAAAVRAQRAAEEREIARQRGEQVAAQEAARGRATRALLREAAALVQREPQAISIALLDTQYGRRVLINPSNDRYDREHLADYNVSSGQIKTTRSLIPHKPAIAGFCAALAARNPSKKLFIAGSDQDWSAP